jgi:hypothetical protein
MNGYQIGMNEGRTGLRKLFWRLVNLMRYVKLNMQNPG